MATRQQFLAELARHSGASHDERRLEETYELLVDAPDGTVWIDGAVSQLVCEQVLGVETRSALYADAINRMRCGLEPVAS